jgi:hypothetical protein
MSATPPDHYELLLEAAAHRLVDTLSLYRILTRRQLADLSGEGHWRTISFPRALTWAIDHDLVRHLGGDVYEICSPASVI